MITIESLTTISHTFVQHLHEVSKAEVEQLGDPQVVFGETDDVYCVHEDEVPLLMLGVKKGSLISGEHEIWMLMFKYFKPRHARHYKFVLETVQSFYDKPLIAQVTKGNTRAERFIEFCRFTPVSFNGEFTKYRMN